ncbi:MAG: hypothetical protein ACE145_13580 [Terriglobia bacterium]
MQNPFAWLFRKVFRRFCTFPAPPKPSLSRDQVRELLIEVLEDPALARLMVRRLALPAFPMQGGVMTAAADVTSGNFGANYSDGGDYNFAGGGRVGVGTASPAFPLHVVSSGISDVRSEAPNYAKHSWKVTNGGTDQKAWQLYADAISNALFLGALNDAEDAQTAALHIKRGTGTAISSVNFPSGNVGIGTASPGHKLDVAGSGGYNQSIYSHASDGGLTRFGLQNTSRHWTISNYGTTVSPNGIFAIADETAGNVRLAIDTSGNVGVGTTSPLVKLDARGANAKATAASFENIIQAASNDSSNPLTLRAGIKTDSTAGNRYGAVEVDDAGTKRPLALQPSGGNVGIGRTDPQAPLHVKGGDIMIEPHPTAGGGLAFLAPGGTSARNVIYKDSADFTVLRNWSQVYTNMRIWAPTGAVLNDREATLALVRGDNEEEFMDFYNNGYSEETQYGIRIQKRIPQGQPIDAAKYRDFVIDQADGPALADRTFILVVRPTRKVGIGTRDTPAKLSVKGESFTASGTVSASGTSVSGTNTLFKQEVDPGDRVTISGQTRTVTSVSSETSLTVDSAFSGSPSGSMIVINQLLRVDDSSGNVRVFVTDQGNVGIGTGSPATSALLDLSSNTGALIVPRMTTTQRDAMTAVNGMIIYNTTVNQMQGYINDAWAAL